MTNHNLTNYKNEKRRNLKILEISSFFVYFITIYSVMIVCFGKIIVIFVPFPTSLSTSISA